MSEIAVRGVEGKVVTNNRAPGPCQVCGGFCGAPFSYRGYLPRTGTFELLGHEDCVSAKADEMRADAEEARRAEIRWVMSQPGPEEQFRDERPWWRFW